MSCPYVQETDLSEWGETLVASMNGGRYPLSGTLELTDRCNLGCQHCYINQPATSREFKASELTTQQVKTILDQIAEAGCLFLLMTGGEMLLRPDFPEIYRYAHQKGMLVTLFTNGTMITPRIADLLAEYPPRSIEITLYGATAETYEKVTQVKGSYAQCMRGIHLLLERKLPLSLKSIVITTNQHELEQMKSLVESLGVSYRYDGLLWPRIDGSDDPTNYQIPLEQLIELDFQKPDTEKEWLRIASLSKNQPIRAKYVYSCGAGVKSFHINSAGKMSVCTMVRRPTFDLLQTPFKEAWETMGQLRQLTRKLDTRCQTCTMGSLCQQCPGWSQTVHDDDETPVDFICNLAHQRAKKLNLNVREIEYYEQETVPSPRS